MDSATLAVVLAIIAIVVAVGVVLYLKRRRRTELRRQFGPEYERVARREGTAQKADTILEARTKRVERFQIRALTPADRDRFRTRWLEIQRVFVDDPQRAVADADRLIVETMRTRGYPVEEDFDRRADDLSVHYPAVVDPYR